MSADVGGWLPALLVSVVMLVLGVRMRLLSMPDTKMRCGACRRIVRRGSTCPCSRVRPD